MWEFPHKGWEAGARREALAAGGGEGRLLRDPPKLWILSPLSSLPKL